MLTCLFDLNGIANLEASHKDPESIGLIVQVGQTKQGVNCGSETGFIILKRSGLQSVSQKQ